jgi:predicted dehydrogenase
VQKLKLLISNGVTGRAYVTSIEIAWRRRKAYYSVPWRGHWKTELGGPLLTLAFHAYDLLQYVLGPARTVFALAKTLVNPIETEDCVSASLEMDDNSLASLLLTTGSSQEISRHRFCFSGLSAESNTHPYNNSSDPWIFTSDTQKRRKQINETLSHFTPLSEGYIGQFDRFHQALQQGMAPPVTLADARASLELVTALYDSIQTGKAITLPISRDHPKYVGWQP